MSAFCGVQVSFHYGIACDEAQTFTAIRELIARSPEKDEIIAGIKRYIDADNGSISDTMVDTQEAVEFSYTYLDYLRTGDAGGINPAHYKYLSSSLLITMFPEIWSNRGFVDHTIYLSDSAPLWSANVEVDSPSEIFENNVPIDGQAYTFLGTAEYAPRRGKAPLEPEDIMRLKTDYLATGLGRSSPTKSRVCGSSSARGNA